MSHPQQHSQPPSTMLGNREMISRAERFEDEKRRLIDSCFSKTDQDGSPLETYITHVRITEYATHPSAPPPAASRTKQNEKARVIIVAVKRSGRVQMHKSKENANGTFSIGKTWALEDLKSIESFTGPQADPQKAENAGKTGFIVNIGKPYFWRAQAEKEKRFFIASLVKIFSKYTGGNTPELIGFEQRELDQMTSAAASQRSQQSTPARHAPQHVEASAPPTARNPSISSNSSMPRPAPSRDNMRVRSPQPSNAVEPTPSIPPQFQQATPLRQPPHNFDGHPSPPPTSLDSSRVAPAVGLDSQPRLSQPRDPSMRRIASGNMSQDSLASGAIPTRGNDSPSYPGQRSGGSGTSMRFGEPITAPPHRPDSRPELRPDQDRSPTPSRQSGPDHVRERDLVPAPLIPGPKGDLSSQMRNRDRSISRKERYDAKPELIQDIRSELGSFKEKGSHVESPPPPGPLSRGFSADTVADSQSPAFSPSASARGSAAITSAPVGPAITSQAPPVDEAKGVKDEAPGKVSLANVLRRAVEVSRQNSETSPTDQSKFLDPISPLTPSEPADDESLSGLGPMFKRRSGGDIAGAFWKAATVAGVFKPRAGGAMDQLRKAQDKNTQGPDGITSVVPAPARVLSSEDRRASIPDVKVSEPTEPAVPPKPEKPVVEEEPTRAFTVGDDEKYLQAIGMDLSILDKRGKEYAHWLDYFHWVPGSSMRQLNYDDMKLDVNKEIHKAQGGSWVTQFQEQDWRVDAIKSGLDVAIAECDELENLLTLYSVELATLQDDIAYIEAQSQSKTGIT